MKAVVDVHARIHGRGEGKREREREEKRERERERDRGRTTPDRRDSYILSADHVCGLNIERGPPKIRGRGTDGHRPILIWNSSFVRPPAAHAPPSRPLKSEGSFHGYLTSSRLARALSFFFARSRLTSTTSLASFDLHLAIVLFHGSERPKIPPRLRTLFPHPDWTPDMISPLVRNDEKPLYVTDARTVIIHRSDVSWRIFGKHDKAMC